MARFQVIKNWEPELVGLEGIQYQANFGVTTFETHLRDFKAF